MTKEQSQDNSWNVQVDLWGAGENDLQGSFNPLLTMARLRGCFKRVILKTRVKTGTLVSGDIGVSQARKLLREEREKQIIKCFSNARALLENRIERTLETALRDLTYKVFEQTLKDLRTEVSIRSEKGLKAVYNSTLSEFKRLDRIQKDLPKLGRPTGSKKKERKFSKAELYGRLEEFILSKDKSGEEITQQDAAEALGLGYPKRLRRMLTAFGDKREWKEIVSDIQAEQK